MTFPHINWLAVFAAALAIFVLGGLWYSPVLFARKWLALQGRTPEQMKTDAANSNMPVMYLLAFLTSLVTAWVMAMFLAHLGKSGWMMGAHLGALAWLGFAAPTSYATAQFTMKPKQIWLIDTMYNLVSFVIAGAILGAWT